MDYSGLGAALQSFGGFMTDRAERKEYEKKEKERLEAAKKAKEEAERKRVERRQLYLKQPDYNYGPPQLAKPTWYEMGTNAQGEIVQDIPANAAQVFNIEQESAAARAKSEAAAKEEEMERLKFESQMSLNKARQAQAYAGAESSRAYAKNLASPTGNEEDAMKDVTYLLTDPYAREAIDAGDPNIAGRWGRKPGAIESFIKGALSKAGVEVPEVSPSVMASLSRTEDPAVRAQIIQTYVRELRQAQAQGLGKLKGVKPKTEQ